jgi:molybdopterin converting factor small subunit
VTIGVTIRYHNIFRHAAGSDAEHLHLPAGSTVGDALHQLCTIRCGALGNLLLTAEGDIASHVVVFRNRKLVTHDQFDATLADGDELKLFPAISGG